jgi:sugar phosphate isomerase/epimerase
MFLGYNTNGFAHHRLNDAVAILTELGYTGIGLTPDVNHLDPEQPNHAGRIALLRGEFRRTGLRCAIETGARFLLDARRKHHPTLLSADETDRETRFDFLCECVELARELGADCVSFWSGAADDNSEAVHMERLAEACKRLAEFAAERNVRLAFEPEPGMFIDSMPKFAELHEKVNHPAFGLTIDIGHLVCQRELPISAHLTNWAHVLWNVHIEDMRAGVHDHLMFGEGEVDFADAFAGLRAANYANGVYVELSRHSYDAVNTARRAKEFLAPFVQ